MADWRQITPTMPGIDPFDGFLISVRNAVVGGRRLLNEFCALGDESPPRSRLIHAKEQWKWVEMLKDF
ncbi:unnamed protein product [Haemonchus placei]|uniref:Tnp_DNA_bind domain-containing protein n=1 Tax=Haemonchus placei TaxID=6290 RepID=A0A0N4VSF1_HAEPC|nr:unnamed protein product [Haemonchus placei]